MARGRTDVRYFGGIMNGKIEEQVNTRFMVDSHSVFHDSFYAIDSKGGQALLEDESKRHLWDHHLVDIYKKAKQTPNVSGMRYEFSHTEIRFRCNAINNNGKRCKNESNASRICLTHSKVKELKLFKHSFNVVQK